MQQLLIDTNIYAAFKRNDPVILDILRQAETISVTTVVLGELLAGFKGGNKEALNRRELDLFLDSPRVKFLAVEETTAEFFALVFHNLKQAGKPIPVNDIWIAASAMQHGSTLLTLDNHFSNIAGLSLHPLLARS